MATVNTLPYALQSRLSFEESCSERVCLQNSISAAKGTWSRSKSTFPSSSKLFLCHSLS